MFFYVFLLPLLIPRYGGGGSGYGGRGGDRGGRGGYGSGGGGGFGGSRNGWKDSQPGERLRKPKWDLSKLVPFERNFYQEHPNITNSPMVSHCCVRISAL